MANIPVVKKVAGVTALLAVLIVGCDKHKALSVSIRPGETNGSGHFRRDVLSEYQQADPNLELEIAMKEGDTRFVGVMNIGPQVPGVRDNDLYYVSKFGVKFLPYTSDAVKGTDHLEISGHSLRFCCTVQRFINRRISRSERVRPKGSLESPSQPPTPLPRAALRGLTGEKGVRTVYYRKLF